MFKALNTASTFISILGASVTSSKNEDKPPAHPLKLLSSIPVHTIDQAYPTKVKCGEDGLGGNNKTGWKEVGSQRGPMVAFLRNIIMKEASEAQINWKSLQTAFQHQKQTGEFEQANVVDGHTSTPATSVTTMGFYFSEACHSLLILRDSQDHFGDGSFGDFRNQLDKIKEKINLSLKRESPANFVWHF